MPRISIAVVRWMLGAALLGSVSAPAAEPAWQMLEAPRFTVFSQLREDRTRAWAEEFSRFTEEVVRMFATGDRGLPPLTVVIFARDADFTPYKGLRPDGKRPRDIAGFFKRRENWSIVGMAGGYAKDELRQVIFHEGVHWAMSSYPLKVPVWVEEGVAEVFSTFKQRGDQVRWGSPIENHINLLRSQPMLPLERLLFLDRSDPLFNESTRTSLFYAQSWFFVHYLLYGNREGSRQALDDYLRGLAESPSADEAFRRAFGGDYRTVERRLRQHLERGGFIMPEAPLAATGWEEVAIQPAPAHRVEAARSRLALGRDTYALAERHARRAIELAPDQPHGHEALAAWARETGDYELERAASTQAAQLGSEDPGTLISVAESIRRDTGGWLGARDAREVVNLYHRVVERAPGIESAYVQVARLVDQLDTIAAADVATLKQGAKRFPWNGEIIFGVAALLAKTGDYEQAIAVSRAARQRKMPDVSREHAEQQERRWEVHAAQPRIEALVEAGDYAGAIAQYDALLQQVRGTPEYAALRKLREQAAARGTLHEAATAARDGDIERARGMLDQLLLDPELAPEWRERAREQRAALDTTPAR